MVRTADEDTLRTWALGPSSLVGGTSLLDSCGEGCRPGSGHGAAERPLDGVVETPMVRLSLLLTAVASLLLSGCGKCEYRDDLASDAEAAKANFSKLEKIADKSFTCYAGKARVDMGPSASADSLVVGFPEEVSAEEVDKTIQAEFKKQGFELENTQKQDNGVIIHSFKSGDEGYVVSIGRVGKQPDVEIFHHTKPK